MKCDKCQKDFLEREIHEHHIHPRFMDNKKGIGKKACLCKKCHNILHLIIPSVLFRCVLDKQSCINSVINFTNKWVNKKEEEDDIIPKL